MGVGPDLEHCYLPAGTVPGADNAPTCSSSPAQLGTLVVYNAVVAGILAFTGHKAIRDRVRPLLRSSRWRPWGAIAAFFVEMVVMLVVTAIARSNGYPSDFWAIFSLWALRPRIGLVLWFCMAVSLWTANGGGGQKGPQAGPSGHQFSHEPAEALHDRSGDLRELSPEPQHRGEPRYRSPYGWSFRDNMFFDGLMNLVAVLCAMSLKGGMADDTYGCRVRNEYPDSPSYRIIFVSLNFTIFAAVTSIAAVVLLLFEVFLGDDEDRLSFPSLGFGDSLFCFAGGKTSLYMFLFLVTSLGVFISNWVFWASELSPVMAPWT